MTARKRNGAFGPGAMTSTGLLTGGRDGRSYPTKPAAFFIGAIVALSIAGAATARTYTCAFTGRELGKSIPDYVIIEYNEDSGSVTVNDPIIKKYLGAPLDGTLKSLNRTRALFSWRLPAQHDAKGDWIPGVTFTVNIIQATGKATISSNPGGNYRATRASGTCAQK